MPSTESQTPIANPPANSAARNGGRFSQVRQFVESLLCLALAVIVFRTFEVEGYMISTGSMAPALLGFHKRTVCPTCKYPFAVGVSYQSDSSRTISGDGDEKTADHDSAEQRQLCTCPNCGQQAIDISRVPRNQGDQLLVFREAYWRRLPRRWEVIVFRNPYETTQAYVKRLAGLPGETIEIRNGDVFADGKLCRKDYKTQKAVRIPVYHHDYEPADDPEWKSRWQSDPGWKREGHGYFTRGQPSVPQPAAIIDGEGFAHGLESSPAENPLSWVTCGNYFRSGGRHVTAVEVPIIKGGLKWPHDLPPAQFDLKTRRLSVTGVMSAELRDRLRAVSENPEYQQAVEQLSERSHYSPVMDHYGYNRPSFYSGQNAVRDVMLSLKLHIAQEQPADREPRQFALDMTDGLSTFRMLWDFRGREIQLLRNPERSPNAPPVRTAVLRSEWDAEACEIEMSLIDRQVTVAVNGEEIFPAWPIADPPYTNPPPRYPVRFGSRGLAARVDTLQLFRDIYYTSQGDEKPFTLKENELYVLGDNSPVSLDSRRWDNGAVPLKLLLGKPFVVHLPSRQMEIRIGESLRHIRIPDFSRVRYIR